MMNKHISTKNMYNPITMKKIIWCFLSIININQIDLCVINTKEHIIYPQNISYISFISLFWAFFWPKIFDYTKICFMYKKTGYWSTNDIKQKRNSLQKKFDYYYSK